MPRNPTTLTKAALLAEQTGSAFWYLAEFSHPTWVQPIRLCTNNQVVTRLGFSWEPAFFQVGLPGEDADRIASATMSVPFDQDILTALLGAKDPPVAVKLYVAPSHDDSVFGPWELAWRETGWDIFTITGSLEPEDLLNELYPKDEFVPSKFPGGFR